MTVKTNQIARERDRVTVRCPQDVAEWLEALVANGHYHNKTEAWQDAAQRIVRNPPLLWAVARTWQGEKVKRSTFRVSSKLLAQINELDREGWISSPSEAFRVGLALIANEHLESVNLNPATVPAPTVSTGPECSDCGGRLVEDDLTGHIECISCKKRWEPSDNGGPP